MKRKMIAIALVSVVVSSPWIYAQTDQGESFYRMCIDKRIERCLQKARLKEKTRSEIIKLEAERAQNEADYLMTYRDQLEKTMADQGIGHKPYKVDQFLGSYYREYELQN